MGHVLIMRIKLQIYYKAGKKLINRVIVISCNIFYLSKSIQNILVQYKMFGKLKSLTSKAINSLPSISIPAFSSKIIIQTPTDNNLQAKLNSISSQILKAEQQNQFRIYQNLQEITEADFNRKLRVIYQYQGCQTQTLNIIIRFYTFLLTNCKNQLVICKLVSEPLVIELTKIVLQTQTKQAEQVQDRQMEKCLNSIRISQKSDKKDTNSQEIRQNNVQRKEEIYQQIRKSDEQQQKNIQKTQVDSISINSEIKEDCQFKEKSTNLEQVIFTKSSNSLSFSSLNYLNSIDWEEVNVYKIALVRSYINCINAETIKYMIIYDNLPIFVNCINSYIHYLSDGVEGTCLGNCILMILTKVNHNDQVCEIIFSVREGKNNRLINEEIEQKNVNSHHSSPQKLSKTISKQKDIRLHQFIQYILLCLNESISKLQKQLITLLNEQKNSKQLQNQQENSKQVYFTVKRNRKIQNILQFIQSNSLFCTDLLNSITNYNYTTTIRKKIKMAVDQKLISNFKRINEQSRLKGNKVIYNFSIIRSIRYILNVSMASQAEQELIKFLNQIILQILQQSLNLNKVFLKISSKNQKQEPFSLEGSEDKKLVQIPDLLNCQKNTLTYLCDISLIVLKLIMSPHSKLASRKRLQVNQDIKMLKQNILKLLLQFLQQMVTFQQLKERICYKTIRNLLLAIFYLTIKQDKCTSSYSSKKGLTQIQSPQKLEKSNDFLNLTFKYNILQLHKIFTLQFKKHFNQNKNWQFIVNHYEQIMKSIPNTSLSPEQSQKFCHYHNGNNSQEWDEVRNHIYICEAVRNYRYMIVDSTKIDQKLIRLQNIYHKNFITKAWKFQPGETYDFTNQKQTGQVQMLCHCMLINNNSKLPIQIIQDEQCFVLALKKDENSYKIVANIRFKRISSFVPQNNQNLIRIKLQGVQQIVLQVSQKYKTKFKEYLTQKRNRSRQKQLKFINYYLNMYLSDSQKMLQEIYSEDIIDYDCQKNVDHKVQTQQIIKMQTQRNNQLQIARDKNKIEQPNFIQQRQNVQLQIQQKQLKSCEQQQCIQQNIKNDLFSQQSQPQQHIQKLLYKEQNNSNDHYKVKEQKQSEQSHRIQEEDQI